MILDKRIFQCAKMVYSFQDKRINGKVYLSFFVIIGNLNYRINRSL